MISYAVTGTIGSGKSLFMQIASRYYPVISCDDVNSRLLDTSKEVKAAFSDCLSEGKLDRKKVAAKVFADEKERKRLESFMHPLILAEVQKWMNEQSSPAVFVEVPLLFESGWEKYFDKSILVYTPVKLLYKRLYQNRHMSYKEARSRIASQLSLREKKKRADIVLVNDAGREEFEERATGFLKNLCDHDL